MKVAVSIPDPVFAEAELLAQHLGTTRSGLYARALSEFVAIHAPDRLAKSWNDVIDEIGSEPDPFLQEAQRQALARIEW